MKSLKISIENISELPEATKQILKFCEGEKVFAFYAPMGAGKTTLIKELCKQLGSSNNFSSPTFSIANEYSISSSEKIYHLDLYRIKDLEEVLAIGVEDYLSGENYCFIEWAEIIEPLLPDNVVKIHIELSDNLRNVSIFRRTN